MCHVTGNMTCKWGGGCLGTTWEFTAVLTGFLVECGFRVWMWTLWSSSTFRSTRPLKWGGAPTVPTAASTPTWAPPATSRWSWPRRSRSSPNQRRRSPRRKRCADNEGNDDWQCVQTNWEMSCLIPLKYEYCATPPAVNVHLISVCLNTLWPPKSSTDQWGRLDSFSWCCSDDHLGHLWMNHENKPLNSEQLTCMNSVEFCDWRVNNSEFVPQVSQKKLKKQKLMARE